MFIQSVLPSLKKERVGTKAEVELDRAKSGASQRQWQQRGERRRRHHRSSQKRPASQCRCKEWHSSFLEATVVVVVTAFVFVAPQVTTSICILGFRKYINNFSSEDALKSQISGNVGRTILVFFKNWGLVE